MDALSRATQVMSNNENDAQQRPRTSISGGRRKDPLRQSLTSTFLRRMVEEVDAEVDSKIRGVDNKAEAKPSAAEKTGIDVAAGEKAAPKIDESPAKQLAMSASTGLSTLAEEREALKQRRRLEALNRSAKVTPTGTEGAAAAEAKVRPGTAGNFVSIEANIGAAGEQDAGLVESGSVEVGRGASPGKDTDADTSITITNHTGGSSLHSDGTARDDEADEDDTEACISDSGGASSAQEVSPRPEMEELVTESLEDGNKASVAVEDSKGIKSGGARGVWQPPQGPPQPMATVPVVGEVDVDEATVVSDASLITTKVRSAISDYKALQETEDNSQKKACREELLELHRELGDILGLTSESMVPSTTIGSGSTTASSTTNSNALLTQIPPEQLADTLDKYSDALMALFQQKLSERK